MAATVIILANIKAEVIYARQSEAAPSRVIHSSADTS